MRKSEWGGGIRFKFVELLQHHSLIGSWVQDVTPTVADMRAGNWLEGLSHLNPTTGKLARKILIVGENRNQRKRFNNCILVTLNADDTITEKVVRECPVDFNLYSFTGCRIGQTVWFFGGYTNEYGTPR
ncbi:hypothetical protein KIPB_008048 [Kipferlia bialata]|uniref:Uncharacterized protein n=1 Tax=Kipferlia bialata TaxID=797122 RepID=A0A9K3GL48_9EUKA|nr:hypothetical protein KIPB_008048 [Kipferlia bialata]|eukprot:g8048.t1